MSRRRRTKSRNAGKTDVRIDPGHPGRRPLAAFGNSDGDLQMSQATAAGSGRRFMLIVHHDDEVREFAYDRQSRVGRLDKAWDEAKASGWTVVSMKNDGKRIFSFDK